MKKNIIGTTYGNLKMHRMALQSCVFESVVAVVFKRTFRVEIHQNDVFLFFKNYFLDQHIKTI
jgi:hypothetical protein